MKKYFLLIAMFLLFPLTTKAFVFQRPAINHITKECGYYEFTSSFYEKEDILRIIPTNNWEIFDYSTLDFNEYFTEYCKSINYSISTNEVPYTIGFTWKSSVFIFVITVLFVMLFFLSKKKK